MMAGFAGLVTLAFFVSFALSTGITLQLVGTGSAFEKSEVLLERFDLDSMIRQEAIDIRSLVKGPNQVKFNVSNVGSMPIAVDVLNKCDVIIEYYRASDGEKTSVWLPYSSSPSNGSWYIDAVFTGDSSGEGVNPIDAGASKGHWDPGETLQLIAALPEGEAIDLTKPLGLAFVAPLGSIAMKVG